SSLFRRDHTRRGRALRVRDGLFTHPRRRDLVERSLLRIRRRCDRGAAALSRQIASPVAGEWTLDRSGADGTAQAAASSPQLAADAVRSTLMYHSGEIDAQRRAGVRDLAERVGGIIGATIPQRA